MKRFYLLRREDETGVSGTGIVALGVQFPDGRCVMRWLTNPSSFGVYDSIEDVEKIHGHGGRTVVEWIDS